MSANDYAHRQLTRVVAGAVDDAFKSHPEYLTPQGKRSAKGSVVKRVTGTVLSFAVHAARGRVVPAVQEPEPNQVQVPVSAPTLVDTGAGASLVSPNPHCRIGRIRDKSTGRYLSRRELRHAYYRELYARLSPEQREAARAIAATRGRG